jgi:predicted PurR-regulated permease PerM
MVRAMDDQDSKVYVSRQQASLIFLALAVLALLPLLLQIMWPFLTPFMLASILAIVVDPANKWVRSRVGRPSVAAFITTLAVGVLLGIVVVALGFALTQELTAAYDSLSQRSLEEGGWAALVTNTADRVVETLATYLPINQEAIRTEILERMKTVTEYLLRNVGGAVGGLTTTLITILLVTIFLYFLLRYGAVWVERLAAIVPLDRHTTSRLFQTVQDSVIANVNGVVVVALAQGLLLGVGFWFVGVRSPVLWGAIGGAASILPLVGSPLVWVPLVIAFIVMGSFWKALILGLWGALIVGSVDNVLRSVVVGRRERQHPLLVALAVVGGTYAFGVLGILFGPLVISLIIALVAEIQAALSSRRLALAHEADEPIAELGQQEGRH